MLYRDVDNFYGPLSQYFNAALFASFGPSLMHLVAANLLIFAAILTMTYLLFRRAWGVGAALTSLALFIAVFGFSQLGGNGNYNYVTPYAHETTHGIFVCLALVIVLVRWVEQGTLAGSFLIGLLAGCTLVLKPEFMLASVVVMLGAMAAKGRWGSPTSLPALALMGGAAILPTASFALYFATIMPWGDAINAACRGWLNAVTTTRFSGYPMELSFLGLDRPAERFCNEILATVYACALVAMIGAGAWLAGRPSPRWLYWLGVGLMATGMVWVSANEVVWPEVGRCLPGLMLIYVGLCAASLFGAKHDAGDRRAQVARFLIALLALALLARMFLNPRIYHFGYVQAVMAAIALPAILIEELPQRLGLGRRGAMTVAIGTFALLLPGVVILCAWSIQLLGEKTVPVGTGGDLFYSSRYDRTGEFVDAVSAALRQGPRDRTLLVLPEGITRYGSEPGEGKELIDWVTKNYGVEAAQGGNPLDCYQLGVVVLTRKPGFP
jgi:hypothetical protein